MGNLSEFMGDPTLAAVDAAIVAAASTAERRDYLGMSEIGDECERNLWFRYNNAACSGFDADTLRRFHDGHVGEGIMADRLRMVPGIVLHTVDPSGNQFGFTDLDNRFGGHMDGAILGLLQAPNTWHVWEHKQVGERGYTELTKLKRELGEKRALEAWNPTYYAQAVLYMRYSGMDRHYMTVATPGGRKYQSVRTEANKKKALMYREKAERILSYTKAPVGISKTGTHWKCKMCEFREVCI